MKIGLLTYHSVYNFGAGLQVFSTLGYLDNNGHEALVINWVPADLEERYDKTIPAGQAAAHREFINEHLPLSGLCRTAAEVAAVIEKNNIGMVIIGSDAVLQHSTLLSRITVTKKGLAIRKKPGSDVLYPNPFWGEFIPFIKKDIPVVVMSASSQNTRYKLIRGKLRKDMEASLKQFRLVTVRDTWTRDMITSISRGSIAPDKTPDPVFAYNNNISDQISKDEVLRKFSLPERYLLVSFRTKRHVSADWMTRLKETARQHNMECVALAMPDGIMFNHEFSGSVNLPLRPDEWYSVIKYSAGYIGENMHPVVVAIHNCVPFFSFDSYGIVRFKYHVVGKSSKIYDILADAGLLQNRVEMLGRAFRMPEPEKVIERITGFDFDTCNRFREQRHHDYEEMMKRILTIKS